MQNICVEHHQQIVGFDNQEKKPVCLLCLAEFSGNIVLNEEATILIKKFKEKFLEEYHSKFLQSIDTLKQFTKKLYDLKNFLSQVIDKLMSNLNDWETSMPRNKEMYEKQVDNIENLNFEAFVKKYNGQQIGIEKKFKNLIFEQASKLLSKQKLDDCVSHLKKLLNQSMVIKFDRQQLMAMQQQVKKLPQQTQLKIKCKLHDSEVIMLNVNQKVKKEDRLICVICIQNNPQQYLAISDACQRQKQSDEIIKAYYNGYQETSIQKVESIVENFKKLKFESNSTIDNVIVIVNQQSSSISAKINQKLTQLERDWLQMTEKDLMDMAEFLSQPLNENILQKEIQQDLKNIEEEIIDQSVVSVIENLPVTQFASLNTIFQFLQGTTQFKYQMEQAAKKDQAQRAENLKQVEKEQSQLAKKKTFQNGQQNENLGQQFFLIQERNQQQTENCFSLSFNQDNSLMAVGCGKDIKIFTFQNATLTLLQILQGHSNFIKCLCFGLSNTIYSCSSGDKQIKIWTQEDNQQNWNFKIDLLEHEDSILCILLNNKENMLISGSCDKSIKCWIKNTNQWKCEQTLKFHNSNVNILAFNESENCLLSCGRDKKLNIFELNPENQWQAKQQINLEYFGFKASFIRDNQFVIQYDKIESQLVVQIYEKNNQSQNYEMNFQACDNIFQGQQHLYPYIGCDFKIIISDQNVQPNLEEIKSIVTQNITFRCDFVYGCLTKSGEYLITWDSGQNQIQIRKKLLY